jgi:hypothetical protein
MIDHVDPDSFSISGPPPAKPTAMQWVASLQSTPFKMPPKLRFGVSISVHVPAFRVTASVRAESSDVRDWPTAVQRVAEVQLTPVSWLPDDPRFGVGITDHTPALSWSASVRYVAPPARAPTATHCVDVRHETRASELPPPGLGLTPAVHVPPLSVMTSVRAACGVPEIE